MKLSAVLSAIFGAALSLTQAKRPTFCALAKVHHYGRRFLIANEKGYFKKLGLDIETGCSWTASRPCRR